MKNCFLFLMLYIGLVSCSTPRNAQLATEYPPKGEEKATDKIIGLLKERLEKDYPAPARTQRDAHPKQHGLVKAEFIVEPDLPKELKIGIFGETRTYESRIRYSNLSPENPDIKKDSRGMAIKVMGVDGPKILPDLANAATKLWKREDSPFIKVATIKVLRQEFDTPAQQLYGDNLSFSPWHSLPVHRPLGGVNRGRRAIYDVMSKFRHDRNEEAMTEPAGWADFRQ